MDLSLFLAKVMGLYFLIISAAVFINRGRFSAILNAVVQNPALLFVLAFNLVILGLLLVIGHNVWDGSWRVVITVLSWIVLVKGTLNLCFPNLAVDLTEKMIAIPAIWFISIAINLMLGLYLCYMGFGG